MKIKCCIIDDEPLAQELLEGYVSKTPFLELVGTYSCASEAIRTITTQNIDLVFLDVQMPELNGIEFSRTIPERTRIIFTTAFERYAVDSYRVNALDYLLKPFSYSDFMESVNKAIKWFELVEQNKSSNDYIIIKSEYKLIQIEVAKILYVEGLKDYVKIYLEDQQHPILSLMSLKMMEEALPSNNFIRVHRSFIVQTDKIRVIERNRIVFGKQYIPISDTYKQAFNDYISRHSFSKEQRQASQNAE